MYQVSKLLELLRQAPGEKEQVAKHSEAFKSYAIHFFNFDQISGLMRSYVRSVPIRFVCDYT